MILLKEFFEIILKKITRQKASTISQLALRVKRVLGYTFFNAQYDMYFWDSCNIQTFHLGRYIVEYTVGNLVVCGLESGTIKCDF